MRRGVGAEHQCSHALTLLPQVGRNRRSEQATFVERRHHLDHGTPGSGCMGHEHTSLSIWFGVGYVEAKAVAVCLGCHRSIVGGHDHPHDS